MSAPAVLYRTTLTNLRDLGAERRSTTRTWAAS